MVTKENEKEHKNGTQEDADVRIEEVQRTRQEFTEIITENDGIWEVVKGKAGNGNVRTQPKWADVNYHN